MFPWRFLGVAVVVALVSRGAPAQRGAAARAKNQTTPDLSVLDPIVQDAIRRDEIPGAVLLVGHNGQVIYRQTFGWRAFIPQREAMTVGTIFDVASLTKIFATTASVMKLMEDGKLATAVAAALDAGASRGIPSAIERSAGTDRPDGATGDLEQGDRTKTGIDVLEEQQFAPLHGKRVGLITNQTGVDSQGRRTIDVLLKAEGVRLVTLFSPEHGIEGRADIKVAPGVDATTGLPIYSLYGETRRPTGEMLRGIDTLVFDLQDAGVRFYTFATTMAYAMEEAAKRHIPFYVLDRPNPLGGEAIEGPMLDRDRLSFVGYFPMPVRHAMTLGELARMFNAENKIGVDLHVIAMKDWHRSDAFEATGVTWIPPSPNLRTLKAVLLYPGIEILQAGGVSVGRGTGTPFELLGAPWIRGPELAQVLNKRFVPGVRFVSTRFTPEDGPYKGQPCDGVFLIITDRTTLHSMLMGLEIAAVLWKAYPDHFALDKTIELVGSQATLERLKRGDAPTRIVEDWAPEIEAFRKIREKYLIYR